MRHLLPAALFLHACAGPSLPQFGDAGAGSPDAADAGADEPDQVRLRNVDVTVVYPLPTALTRVGWLSALSPARGGRLLPAEVAAAIPELDALDPVENAQERLTSLYVVAIRFDPCAGTIVPVPQDAQCQAQLRLVFQSLKSDGQARDGAIHAFYRLQSAEWTAVLADLRSRRESMRRDPEVPLGVHPQLLREGMHGPFAQGLAELVVGYAGPDNLVRVTNFRRIQGLGATWLFSIRDRGVAGWTDSLIATTTVTEQRLMTIVGGRWDAEISPQLTHADDPTRLFDVTFEEHPAAFAPTVRILNPRVNSSESIDCASCHVAHDVAVFAEATLSLSVASHPERFRSEYATDHDGKSIDEAIAFENMHMLSYLGRRLSVSQRVANETAAILELVNRVPMSTMSP